MTRFARDKRDICGAFPAGTCASRTRWFADSLKGASIMSQNTRIVEHGVSFGSALAIVISFTAHKSILWAILHGIFSWFYVIYYIFTR